MLGRSGLALALLALVAAAADPRAQVTAALDAQITVAARTRATVDVKRAEAAARRARRARTAYRLLHPAVGVAPDDRMATARRRAAARWLLERERREEALLADEASLLAAATARLVGDRARAVGAPVPPADLDRPARGRIAGHFGTAVHERSKATLSRRGVDLDVAAHAEVHPVADGVVVYAGPIRGLDHGVIVDHGGWWSITAKLAPPAVSRGAKVARGDVIGVAADERVYLELRVAVGAGGVPIDPEPLLARHH